MKLKNGEIFNAAQPLSKLMDEKFPVKVSLGLAKLVNKLNVELKAIEEVRQGLVKRYGKEVNGQLRVDQEGENFQSCPQDCKTGLLDDLLCWPPWSQECSAKFASWAIYGIILLIIYVAWESQKKK